MHPHPYAAPDARSLNLANSVAVVAYEALRQLGFPGLSGQGRDGGGAVTCLFPFPTPDEKERSS